MLLVPYSMRDLVVWTEIGVPINYTHHEFDYLLGSQLLFLARAQALDTARIHGTFTFEYLQPFITRY